MLLLHMFPGGGPLSRAPVMHRFILCLLDLSSAKHRQGASRERWTSHILRTSDIQIRGGCGGLGVPQRDPSRRTTTIGPMSVQVQARRLHLGTTRALKRLLSGSGAGPHLRLRLVIWSRFRWSQVRAAELSSARDRSQFRRQSRARKTKHTVHVRAKGHGCRVCLGATSGEVLSILCPPEGQSRWNSVADFGQMSHALQHILAGSTRCAALPTTFRILPPHLAERPLGFCPNFSS